jgi:hypothetical protein
MFWVLRGGGEPKTIAPLNAIIVVRIVNNQATASMISQLTVEGNTTNGTWVRLARIEGSTVQLFAVPNSDLHKAILVTPTLLDTMLENRAMSPKETVEGWLLLAYPRGNDEFNGKFRFTVADTMGTKYSQLVAASGAGDFGPNTLQFPRINYDLSPYPVVLYQDSPGYWVTRP